MNKILRRVGLCVIILLGFRTTMAEDYRWIITYPTATNEWGRKMASGENKVVMKAQFINLNSEKEFELRKFAVRLTTTHLSDWYIDSLKLWLNTDKYPGSLDKEKDLQLDSMKIDTMVITPQSSETESPQLEAIEFLGLQSNPVSLGDTSTFFVTMLVKDWRDDNPENEEITDQNGIKFGITVVKDTANVSNSDLRVAVSGDFNDSSNSWGGNPVERFEIRAVNLEATIQKSSTSSKIFHPKYLPIDNDDNEDSKDQIITDLTFVVDVCLSELPENYLSYASLKVGWDNNMLEFDSLWYGGIWDDKQYTDEDDSSGFNVKEVPGDTNYSEVRFEGIVVASPNYVDLFKSQADDTSLVSLKFHILKPGVSPLFLSDVVIMDQWGIPYHIYRTLQNNSGYDAWVKFILGDFTSSDSGDVQINMNGEGDAEVNWADITLFSDYIWMDTSSSGWYSRFDIGSPGSHDPDELTPDDTTNFFDLMVMGTNYYRTKNGSFNQKPVMSVDKPFEVSLSALERVEKTGQYRVKLLFSNVTGLFSAQAKIIYNPEVLEFIGLNAGNWVENASPQHILLYPPELIDKGKIDINFVALDNPLNGEGEFTVITFNRRKEGKSPISLVYFDPRDVNCNKIEYSLTKESTVIEIPKDFILLTNYPNPFNPGTQVSYNIPEGKEGLYQLRIYDILGRHVRTLVKGYHEPEEHRVFWDGKNDDNIPVVNGVYFVQLSGQSSVKTKKIMLLR